MPRHVVFAFGDSRTAASSKIGDDHNNIGGTQCTQTRVRRSDNYIVGFNFWFGAFTKRPLVINYHRRVMIPSDKITSGLQNADRGKQ